MRKSYRGIRELSSFGRVAVGGMSEKTSLLAVALLISPIAVAQTDGGAAPGSPGDAGESGFELFIATGCGACHAIRGTVANGDIGPDLTHLAARRTIAGAMLPLTPETLYEWIRHAQEIKPGARMPSFDMLPEHETAAIVDYLMTLE